MSAIGNFQMYITDRMANDLNTCPRCDRTPVRIAVASESGQERYECANRACTYWSPGYAADLEPQPASPPIAPGPRHVPGVNVSPPGPGPEVFYWGDPDELPIPLAETSGDPEKPRTQWLWITHHHDIG